MKESFLVTHQEARPTYMLEKILQKVVESINVSVDESRPQKKRPDFEEYNKEEDEESHEEE